MQKIAALLISFFIPLYLQSQSATGIVPPQTPQAATFKNYYSII